MTRVVVGLGNPGPEYVETRHNAGFRVLDHVADLEGLLFRPASRLEGYRGPRAFAWARRPEPDALLVKPETFMNRSGDVVAPLVEWVDAAPEDLLVVYDDLDLAPAQLRLRPFGGAGGHNGMRSILDRLGTDRFPRLRVGVGRPGTDAARYVLEPFEPREREEMEVAFAEAADAILAWLEEGDIDECMTRFHSRWKGSAG